MVLLVLAVPAAAQTSMVNIEWTPPTEGSPAVEYIVHISQDGGPFGPIATTTELSVQIPLAVFTNVVARVAAIDELDRQGPWAESEPYVVDPGPPGAPQSVTVSGG